MCSITAIRVLQSCSYSPLYLDKMGWNDMAWLQM